MQVMCEGLEEHPVAIRTAVEGPMGKKEGEESVGCGQPYLTGPGGMAPTMQAGLEPPSHY